MGNRSNINPGGNTTQGQNVGIGGAGVFAAKSAGNILQFKELSVTGTTMKITSDAENIYFSAATGGGGGFSCGSWDQIPYMNVGGTDFDYSSNFIWNDTCLLVKNDGVALIKVEGNGTGTAGLIINQGGSVTHTIAQSGSSDDWLMICNGSASGAITWITTCDGDGTVVIGNQSQSDTWFAVRDRNTSAHACTFSVANTGGSTALNVRCDGLVYMPELPTCVSETCVVYIDGTGKLSTGAGGGGGGSITGGANGLCTSGENIVLGGSLTGNTVIDMDGNDLTFDNTSSDFRVTGNTVHSYASFANYICGKTILSMTANVQAGMGVLSGGDQSSIVFNTLPGGNNYILDEVHVSGISYYADYSTIGATNPRWIPDAAWVTGQTGGGGSGFTISNNGLCDNGIATVGLGGTLSNDTTIDGDSYSNSFNLRDVGSFNVTGGSTTICTDIVELCGCGSSYVGVGASDVVLCSNADGNIVHHINKASSDGCHVFCTGCIVMCDLATKTSETNVLYVDSAGLISSGASGGGGGSAMGWSNLTNESTVAGCGTPASASTICSNTIFGVNAGAALTTGERNVAIGVNALCTTTNRYGRIAIGTNALAAAATDGFSGSVAIGDSALAGNIDGEDNIGIGTGAMQCGLTGNYNISIGVETLWENCGCCNTVIGSFAMIDTTLGDCNTVIGALAGCGNNGSGNVFIGSSAGENETASNKLHIANISTCSLIEGDFTGKTVTIDGKLTTTDFQMTNGAAVSCFLCSDADGNATWATAPSSPISGWTCTATGQDDVSIGNYTYPYAAGSPLNNWENVAIGNYVLCSNTSGYRNTAVGTCVLIANTTGFANVAMGCDIFRNLTTGIVNTAIGTSIGVNLTTTSVYNVFVGDGIATKVCEACGNTYVGTNAGGSGPSNTVACNNVAIGSHALNFNGGDVCLNTAVGPDALIGLCASSSCNVGVGYDAGYYSSGNSNIYIGERAGYNHCGSNNVFIGQFQGSGDTNNFSNTLRIGDCNLCSLIYGCFTNDTICNGADSASWDTSSDSRIKECVCTICDALCTINELNAVSFDYTSSHAQEKGFDEEKRICNYSFVAQEFETVFPKYVTSSNGIINGEAVDDFKTINTGHLVPILVKAIQEQELRIKALEAKLNE